MSPELQRSCAGMSEELFSLVKGGTDCLHGISSKARCGEDHYQKPGGLNDAT